MRMILRHADQLLRGSRAFVDPARAGRTIRNSVLFIIACGLIYGGVMGSYGGIIRPWQVLYSGVKVPLLLLVSFGLSLPSFFVLNTLLGTRDDFPEALRGLVATQAVLAIVLAALAPYTALWYVSMAHYKWAILFNALMFGSASLLAHRVAHRYYRPLIARNPRHRLLLRTWIVLYAFVGIQMGWTLRPFIGDPDMPTEFFRTDAWGNAYVVVVRLIWQAVF